jgi:hypothetical protein
MALAAHALVSLIEAKHELSIEGSELDAQVERYIHDASEWCEYLCGRKLKARAVTYGCAGPPRCELFVDPFPIDITQPITITVDGIAQTVWKEPGDGSQTNFNVIVRSLVRGGDRDHFWRGAGWGAPTAAQPDNVVITYTGGLATVPQLLKDACLILVQKVSRDAVQQFGSDLTSVHGAGGFSLAGNPVPLEAQRKLEAFRILRRVA